MDNGIREDVPVFRRVPFKQSLGARPMCLLAGCHESLLAPHRYSRQSYIWQGAAVHVFLHDAGCSYFGGDNNNNYFFVS